MQKILSPLLFLLGFLETTGQRPYWQQEVNFQLDVSLDDRENSLHGFARIQYVNHSPDTLHFIWFHLWPNAYRNDQTAFSDQMRENGNLRFYFSAEKDRGYMNRVDFKVDGQTAATEDHPRHQDILKLVLPRPLAPGGTADIQTPFHVKLPYNFSRGGHDGQSYQVTQWYPKPAVYDQQGWHPLPYLDQGEFYSEFGRYDVRITLPENYIVAATGVLQDEREKAWLKSRAIFDWHPKKAQPVAGKKSNETDEELYPVSSPTRKTVHFREDRIHDFAWFADKRFIVATDSCRLPSGRIVELFSYYTPAHKKTWTGSTETLKKAVRFYSEKLGEYPYATLSAVQGPESFGGGMEYPGITVLSPTADALDLEYTLVHEVGHNWFYGVLASNERKYPWMDEGMNTYYENRYKGNRSLSDFSSLAMLQARIAEKKDQPINTPSDQFSDINYNLVAYDKAAAWMALLEKELGTELFDRCMQAYYSQWQFKHPQPADFKSAMEQNSGRNLDALFALLDKPGNLPGWDKKGTAIVSPAGLMNRRFFRKKNLVTVFPVAGFNSYDKLMTGLGLTNLKLPPNRFQFLLAPLYAWGSKTFGGTGFANLSLYPNGLFRKIDAGISAAFFTADRFTDADGTSAFLRFRKWAPGIRFLFREKNPRSSFFRYVEFKSFLIGEDGLRFYRDTLISGTDTSIRNRYQVLSHNRTVNRLSVVIENNRALYPYRAEWRTDQGRHFIRTSFTGNYFFNYGKKGGLSARLFAGKFFYTGNPGLSQQFATSRYHLNLTGPNGAEDYTYSDYFTGRNAFEGLASQQIMVRDGAFKVRTDLLASKVGKTDNWLVAANFSSSIPDAINPLSALPFPVPLKVFLDVGTYAEAWERDANLDRFLFDAGLQLSFAGETIQVYLPLLYSPVFRDYLQSTLSKKERFWKKISFSINISQFRFRQFNRHLDF